MKFFIVFKPLQKNLSLALRAWEKFWAGLEGKSKHMRMYCNCKGKMCSTNSEIWNLVSYYEDAIQRRKSLDESFEDEVRTIFETTL